MPYRMGVILLLAWLLLAGCSSDQKAELELVPVIVVDVSVIPLQVQRQYEDADIAVITYPDCYHVCVRVDGIDYYLYRTNTYGKLREHAGDTVVAVFEVSQDKNGTRRRKLIAINREV